MNEKMKVIENNNEDVAVTQAFLVKDGPKFEIRYTLLTDLGNPEDDQDWANQTGATIFMFVSNILGTDYNFSNFSEYSPEDVKNSFNGDWGATVFLQNPQSSYAKGYKYALVDFFYKKGQGLVTRVMLFNNVKAFVHVDKSGNIDTNSQLVKYYNTFYFMEKDENGEFITPDKMRQQEEQQPSVDVGTALE